MDRELKRWEIAGFIFTAAAGTLLHFLYEWSGDNAVAAAFSAANESVWEHMKMLAVPVVLFSMLQFFRTGKRFSNFWGVRGITALVGLLAIPVLFYTYTGILGRDVVWMDAAIFFAADALTFWLDGRLLERGAFGAAWQQLAGLAVLWGLLFAFVWCTYRPPHLPLWRDPRTFSYGLPR